jgi:hypothetical protein
MNALNFTEKFLEIANGRDKFAKNGPAQLVLAAIEYIVSAQGLSYEQASTRLSLDLLYGKRGEVGGVNVYYYTDDQTAIAEYVTTDESTWMTLECAVEQTFAKYPNGIPAWFSDEWMQVRTEYEDLEEF